LSSQQTPQQQYREEDTIQGLICLGVLVIAVLLAFWGRSEIRKRAAAVGSYDETITVAQPPDAIVRYIKKNYDRSSRGNRDWAKKWLSQDPPMMKMW
jgi:hypothetical protein